MRVKAPYGIYIAAQNVSAQECMCFSNLVTEFSHGYFISDFLKYAFIFEIYIKTYIITNESVRQLGLAVALYLLL